MTRTLTFYPTTLVWLAGSLMAVGVSENWYDINAGLVIFTVTAGFVMLVSVMREIRIVHHLVNSQRDELLVRISDLVDALHVAGVKLPDGERQAKDRGPR